MKEQIIETWAINNRVNLMLIDAISEEGMHATLSKRGGGTVAFQFAHLHHFRLLRLEHYAKELMEGQTKIDTKASISKTLLKTRLEESAAVTAQWIEQAIDNGGKIKGFKRGIIPAMGYWISHESHHRGNIMLTLKQCGYKLPKSIKSGIWAWNTL